MNPTTASPSRRTIAATAGFLLATLGLLVGLAVTAPAARAHEGSGVLAVTSLTQSGFDATYQVRLTWANDGHGAVDATVTATPIGPDGTALVPQVLTASDADGGYTGTTTFAGPGAWTLRITAVEPIGTLDVPVVVAAPATSAPATESGSDASGGTEPTITAIAPTGTPGSDDGGGMGGLGIVALVAILAAIAFAVVRFARSSRQHREDA